MSTSPASGPLPLHGVRVLEIGAFMAAPFATMQLADLGADVVKVENPAGGDPVRQTGPFLAGHSSPFLRLNRNKRSVALDLKDPEGRRLLRRLLDDTDVLVENLRPGALAALGLGHEPVRARNPRLIYVSASGWGQDGPLAAQPGLDIMAQARAGLMSITGHPGGPPTKVGVPMCDLVCGLYAALGAVAALRAREHTGQGQHIDVSLLEAGVSFAVWEAGAYFATGETGRAHGSAHQNSAPYQAVRSRDGWVTVGATTTKTWPAFCHALGLTGLLDDDRYGSSYERYQHRDSLIPAIERATAQLGTAEIVEKLTTAGVPCAPIATTDEVFTDEHLAQRDFFWDAPHPELGPVRQIGSPMRLSATPPRRDHAGPRLGAHTREVLTEAGLDADEVTRLRDRGILATGE
ncbi:formyl-CoA transferase [Saccharopolyspora antimicrobica]|uniref:Formyl-CoA transferase n=1 Tax=Saccharopolyspora antimicrobica TaxID=455193 RepID=A0A1I4RHA2_9PSEU|nr:CoA transferase [Saccharopolyspora antimicrobica]RKT88011.1 formyl-CoA transferase [Saccharopolyspora antimicrobica]SFM51597.1 formyl-CoA transferase [Saccharopolyspora antimicrobica]